MIEKSRIDLFKSILILEQSSLHSFLLSFLKDYYGKKNVAELDGNYIYAKGTTEVCVIAHLDTVHFTQPTLDNIYYDSEKGVMWSPVGIGGDDRCGVFIILNLIIHGYRPHILFTWNEEIGGYGAKTAAKRLKPDLNFLIQFDRRGSQESVFYDLDNLEFENYINSFGFKTQYGTYTDICELAPDWNCAAVNLSAGYQREHTHSETIYLKVLNDTLLKTAKILDDQKINPKKFAYKEKFSSYELEEDLWSRATSAHFDHNSYPCYGCSRLYKWEMLNDLGICDNCEDYRSLKLYSGETSII